MPAVPSKLYVVAEVKDGQPLKIVSYSDQWDGALGRSRRNWDGSARIQFAVHLTRSSVQLIDEAACVFAERQQAADTRQAESDAALSPAEECRQLEELCEQLRDAGPKIRRLNYAGIGIGLKKNRRGHVEEVVVYECKRPVRRLTVEIGRKLLRLSIAFLRERRRRRERQESAEARERAHYKARKMAATGTDFLTEGQCRQQFRPIDLLREWEADQEADAKLAGKTACGANHAVVGA